MFCYILDDDPTFCVDFEDQLKRTLGARVETQTDYDTAAHRLLTLTAENDVPDIIFVDYKLTPPKTGLDFIAQLQLERVIAPMVLLTEHDAPEIATKAKAIGSQVILKSSVEQEQLLREVALFALSQWSRFRREQQKEITRQRHQVLKLASGIAHEIANDVTTINSHVRRIEKLYDRDALTPEKFKSQVKSVTEVVQRSVRMTTLLRVSTPDQKYITRAA